MMKKEEYEITRMNLRRKIFTRAQALKILAKMTEEDKASTKKENHDWLRRQGLKGELLKYQPDE